MACGRSPPRIWVKFCAGDGEFSDIYQAFTNHLISIWHGKSNDRQRWTLSHIKYSTHDKAGVKILSSCRSYCNNFESSNEMPLVRLLFQPLFQVRDCFLSQLTFCRCSIWTNEYTIRSLRLWVWVPLSAYDSYLAWSGTDLLIWEYHWYGQRVAYIQWCDLSKCPAASLSTSIQYIVLCDLSFSKRVSG